jgi:cell wall-associated NlpC family hydrolase
MDLTSTNIKRTAVVLEALSWIGTPFHDCAGVKGAGCDCAHLLLRVYQNAGVIPMFDVEPYPPQWFQHRDEPRFLNRLRDYAHEVEMPEVADVVMFKFGRHAAHGGILVAKDKMVHAYKPQGAVTEGSLFLPRGELHSYWSLFP